MSTPRNKANSSRRSTSKVNDSPGAPRFSVSYMDRSADPREDFYRYSAGEWVKTHPVPPDRARWGAFNELEEWNLVLLRRIVERCASDESAARASTARMVGDFYRSACDSKGRERSKFTPIEDLWNLANSIRSNKDLADCVPRLHSAGVDVMFSAYSKADDKDSRVYAFFLEQGGLSLPDREYYIAESFTKLRAEFRSHVARMFTLKGVPKRQSESLADSVLRIETALARASRTRTELRDREKNYNRTAVSVLESRYAPLRPMGYIEGMDVHPTPYVVVGQPEFFEALCRLVGNDLEGWKAYLRWQVLHSYAPYLHSVVVAENFDFFRRRLLGQREPEASWKLAVRTIDRSVGEALGRLYVEEHFSEGARRQAALLVDDIRKAFRRRLEGLPWMTEPTRRQALVKFDAFSVKIGHPKKFRDYSSLVIEPNDYAGNVRRSWAFELRRHTARVGGPVDRSEWRMTPPTVNAYFSQTDNEIVFPAGIFQPPFFDHKEDYPVNYGAIGAVIGHEITHGYDDQGRKYDAKGNLRDWWTPADEREFNARAKSVVEVYSSEEVLPGLRVNGELTLGENIADLGGVSLAYEALQRRLAREPSKRSSKDGFSPDQRFFISYTQLWRQTITEQEQRRLLTVDPHSPHKLRATIPAVNQEAFDRAFPVAPKSVKAPRNPSKLGVW